MGDPTATDWYVRQVYERAYGDGALPLDFEAEVSTEGSLRFSPRNPRVPFLGRKNELAALDAFLTADKPFAWWVLAGSGGTGKTRLARQFCLRVHAHGWRAGFLPDTFRADVGSLDRWHPEFTTLIVADYVLKRIAEIRTLAARLARRGESGLPHVRLLLVEREADRNFRDEICGTDQSNRSVILASRYQEEPLVIPQLSEDELWLLVEKCSWRQDGKTMNVSRPEFFKKFALLDGQRRPLIAIILADAMAAGVGSAGLGGLEEELRDLLRRDRDRLWPTELSVAGRPLGETEADVAITFATMIDGLGRAELEVIKEKRGQALTSNILPACARAIGQPIKDQPLLGKLEPDLIGEFFSLEVLGSDFENPFIDSPHDWMPEAAWRIRECSMADFVRRARQNFPRHRALKKVAITVEGVEESWWLAADDARKENYDYYNAQPGALAAGHILLLPSQSDPAAARAFGHLAGWAALLNSDVIDPLLIADMLLGLTKLVLKYPGESTLRVRFSQSVINFISHQMGSETLEKGQIPNYPHPPDRIRKFCRMLLGEGSKLHKSYVNEPELRELWARGVRSFLYPCPSDDPADCRTLLHQLDELHKAYPGEPALREFWADGVVNFVCDRALKAPSEGRALLEELSELHKNHGNQSVLREKWASAVMNFVRRGGAKAPADCYALLEELARLHKNHGNEPMLREVWAKSVTNFIYHRAAEDPADCYALLVEQAELHQAYLDEAPLREEWANSIANFNYERAAKAPVDCRALLAELAALCAAHRNEPALRKAWAWSVTNFVRQQAAEEPVACRALLVELAALCAAHPNEPTLGKAKERTQHYVERSRHTEPRSGECE